MYKVDLLMPDFGVLCVHNMVELGKFRVVWQTLWQIQIPLQYIYIYKYLRKPILSINSLS